MSAATVTRNPLTYIAGAAAFILALILIATSSNPAAGTTVTGTYDLDAGYSTGCVGAGDYIDIYDGTPVWVFDEPGNPLASSKLFLDEQSRSVCRFTFSVTSGDAPVWVQVGDQAKVRITDPLALRSGPPRS